MGKIKPLAGNILLIVFSFGACFCIFSKTQVCALGIKEGLSLCADSVIPTLFPFMIISQFIVKSGVCDFLGRIFGSATAKIFRLPPVASSVILMSLIGGYPIGAKMTYDLLCDGKITQNAAQKLDLFCINAGPAFIIGTVGTLFLGSTRAGVILYCSVALSSVIIGVLTRFIGSEKPDEFENGKVIVLKNPIEAFSFSVTDSVKAMISVCSWIVIFNCLIKYICSFSLNGYTVAAASVLEVTSGIKMSLNILPVPAFAAIISFGGLSVHCQIHSYIAKTELPVKHFYTSRVLCAAVSALICSVLLKFFPCEIETFANVSELNLSAYSVSLPAACALLLMCSVLIFELDAERSQKAKAQNKYSGNKP